MVLRIIAFSLMAVGGTALFILAAVDNWSRVDWGDAPTWLSAVTTLGALIAASYLVRVELGRDRRFVALDAERREKEATLERNRLERESSSRQADYVAAWCGWNDDEKNPDFRLIFGNGSPLPIYDVVVKWHLPDGNAVYTENYNLIGPGRTVDWIPTEVLDACTEQLPELQYREYASKLKVGIQFRDTAGRIWERDINGVLTQRGITVYPTSIMPLSDDVTIERSREEGNS